MDTPANLYDYPANAYVAFYIGAPTINFLKNVKISKLGTAYAAVSGSLSLELPENIVSRFDGIDEYVNTEKEVILGIRPEDAVINKQSGVMKCKVGKVESDGGSTFAECDIEGGNSIIVRGQSELLKGEEAVIDVDLTRLYIFDAVTRLTLLKRDAGYNKTDFTDADFVPMPYGEELEVIDKLKPKKEAAKKKLR